MQVWTKCCLIPVTVTLDKVIAQCTPAARCARTIRILGFVTTSRWKHHDPSKVRVYLPVHQTASHVRCWLRQRRR